MSEKVIVDITPADDRQDLLAPARGLAVIASPEQRAEATGHLAGVRKLKKAILAHYDGIKRPILDALSNVRRMEAESLKPVEEADAHLTRLLSAFDRQAEEARQAELRRRQAEEDAQAEAQRRQAEEDLRAAARAAGDQKTKRALHAQARAVALATPLPAAVAMPEEKTTDGSGVSTSKTYRAEITSITAVILAAAAGEMLRRVTLGRNAAEIAAAFAFLKPYLGDEEATPIPMTAVIVHAPELNSMAKKIGPAFCAPGVRAVEVRSYAAR